LNSLMAITSRRYDTCGIADRDFVASVSRRAGERRPPQPGAAAIAPSPWALATTPDDAVEIVVSRLDAGPDVVRELESLLSDDERQRSSRLRFDRDRRRFVVARGRLRQLLAERLGDAPRSVAFAYGPHGKPALASRYARSDLRFNLSHCDDVAAFAFCRGREVGLDIESVRALPDAEDIAGRFFSRRENDAYLALAPHDRPLGFFNCWTRKEAFVKALGAGLGYPLDRFDVSLAPGEPAKILRVGTRPGARCGWMIHGFVPLSGMTGAVVVRTDHRSEVETNGGRIVIRMFQQR
jgi:4'-phosphopantetheinyl transferase